jgi:hypothetical protein
MHNLVEYCKINGKFEQVRTWLTNLPYSICKAKKNELEKQPQMATTFFKIIKN